MKRYIPYRLILMYRALKPLLRKLLRKNLRRREEIPVLHIHLADHCNLNCRGCDNFSPLSPEVLAQLSVVTADLARVSELSGGKAGEVQLLGGEPLLHPQVSEFMALARRYFPLSPVRLVTNGILLSKQPDDFWEACRTNDIEIVVTKYPVKLDHAGMALLAKKQAVKFSFYGNTEEVPKSMQLEPLDISGGQDPRDSFLRCSRANYCIALDNGKLYPCSLIPYVKYFNARFSENLEVTDKDYMDIHKAGSIADVLDFISRPAPFCRYCNLKATKWDVGFGVSKKSIEEWTA
jgi:MoaA/NifB/PqqE/SkfB family radical SAM enzyme